MKVLPNELQYITGRLSDKWSPNDRTMSMYPVKTLSIPRSDHVFEWWGSEGCHWHVFVSKMPTSIPKKDVRFIYLSAERQQICQSNAYFEVQATLETKQTFKLPEMQYYCTYTKWCNNNNVQFLYGAFPCRSQLKLLYILLSLADLLHPSPAQRLGKYTAAYTHFNLRCHVRVIQVQMPSLSIYGWVNKLRHRCRHL